jgi:hypothetical protein
LIPSTNYSNHVSDPTQISDHLTCNIFLFLHTSMPYMLFFSTYSTHPYLASIFWNLSLVNVGVVLSSSQNYFPPCYSFINFGSLLFIHHHFSLKCNLSQIIFGNGNRACYHSFAIQIHFYKNNLSFFSY